MKKIIFLAIFFPILLTSCRGGEAPLPYVYNTNPTYTWGYIEYFGLEYTLKQIPNNVLSISLFSSGLTTDNAGALKGTGQFLFLEDVYIAPSEKTLPFSKTFTISNSHDPYTVAPGKNDTVGTEVFPIGAVIYYYEENATKSTIKYITEGTFTVTKSASNFTVNCDFKTSDEKELKKTSDKKELKGVFSGRLDYYDRSLKITKIRKKLHYRF